jgi:hypothetical protein
VNDADASFKDRAALDEMKLRKKNAQAVDRSREKHRRMQKEMLDAKQVLQAIIRYLHMASKGGGGAPSSPRAGAGAGRSREESTGKAMELVEECEQLLLHCDGAQSKVCTACVVVCGCLGLRRC